MATFVTLIIVVAVIAGGAWYYYRGRHMGSFAQAVGAAPAIPQPKSQGAMPMLKMPTAMGWGASEVPSVKAGLKVSAFARDLKHPRWAYVLPNGDVLIAESGAFPARPRMCATMR